MFSRILKELALTFTLCLGERVLQRFLFPGLHRLPERMVAVDPSRVDDMSTLIAEALAPFLVIWLFVGTLYAVGFLIRRPLRPVVPILVAAVILVLLFARDLSLWASLPSPPLR
jgi:hypothetical protein